jgi:hypothetical protein
MTKTETKPIGYLVYTRDFRTKPNAAKVSCDHWPPTFPDARKRADAVTLDTYPLNAAEWESYSIRELEAKYPCRNTTTFSERSGG